MGDNKAFIAAIWVAVIAFVGTVFQGFNESRISARQEDRRFQSELIIRAVETSNPEQALKNLEFLLNAGLITDRGEKLGALLDDEGVSANFGTPVSQLTGREREEAIEVLRALELSLGEQLEELQSSQRAKP